ncbi:hypothetical protein IW261DRAFT_1597938 [Armillaria novae-zelandiae]|uniref:Uncharacterized protein n=1 Tax=Armillaria novae-zelandiae TaxID=153914 RepID=A0AA39NNG4_9AGAR|nr:hypothetical protein IW261DRAFT_1597938 [Armillaria novae-zelandiae]
MKYPSFTHLWLIVRVTIMATGTYPATVIPELTDSQIQDILEYLDKILNDAIITALLYGIYTGVVAITLWAVASSDNCEDGRRPRFLVTIILLLYLLAAVNLYYQWAACIATFTALAWKSVWETYTLNAISTSVTLTVEVSGILSAILADASLIWRCWIVWGRSWRVVLVPIVCTTLATASRGIVAYYDAYGPLISPQAMYLEKAVNWALLYASLIMATLLWCTILIILSYTATHNERAALYVEDLAIAMRGIMPTMLVGRVAAGHARPDDSWNESTPRSSIRFGNHSISQNDTLISVGSGWAASSTERPDLEEGLEGISEVRLEGAAPNDDTHNCHAHVVGTSSSVDYSAA